MISRKVFNGIAILFCLFTFSCQHSEKGKTDNAPLVNDFQETLTLTEKINRSSYIVIGEVVKVEAWKNRQDRWVVTVKPEKIIKGPSASSIKVFVPKLFPKQDLLLREGERTLLFLSDLPSYTAWQDLIEGGVKYGILGDKQGVIDASSDISLFTNYIEEVSRVSKIKDVEERNKKLKKYYQEFLTRDPSGILPEQVTGDYFRLFPPMNLQREDLDFWLGRIQDSSFSSSAKVYAVKQLTTLKNSDAHDVLQKMFCLKPTEVCLRVAENLESEGIELPYYEYQSSIEKGPKELSLGLLVILARHQRKDTFGLFEKYLKQEKDEKNASVLVEALGDFQSPQAESLVLSYAKDPRYYVRIAVASSLGKLKSNRGIATLEEYLKTRDPSMVAVSAQSLKQIGTPRALQTLGKYYELGHHGTWEPVEGSQHFNLPPANP